MGPMQPTSVEHQPIRMNGTIGVRWTSSGEVVACRYVLPLRQADCLARGVICPMVLTRFLGQHQHPQVGQLHPRGAGERRCWTPTNAGCSRRRVPRSPISRGPSAGTSMGRAQRLQTVITAAATARPSTAPRGPGGPGDGRRGRLRPVETIDARGSPPSCSPREAGCSGRPSSYRCTTLSSPCCASGPMRSSTSTGTRSTSFRQCGSCWRRRAALGRPTNHVQCCTAQ